ncbi:hypothetical protein BJX63DRAFT_396506 [Aspergillus granulosus]|uniref:Uncharacterized protein n=1 Tax=Aspergillus granulosus TaxID=176169 RepID=A0ABR4HCI3_9EURO
MTAFQFSGQRLDRNLVASISSLLDDVNIPNLLWGNYLLTVYGVPTIVDGVCFVVPDTLIDIAFSTLAKAGFQPCSSPVDCPHQKWQQPYIHLHLNDELAIKLHRQTDILWDFPELETAFHKTNQDIMLASDARLPQATLGRGRGRFSYPTSVQILSASRYCEALISLLCRDYDTIFASYWMAILTYIVEFVDGTDVFDEESLRDGYKQFYHALKLGDPIRFSILKNLRRDYIEQQPCEASKTKQTAQVISMHT